MPDSDPTPQSVELGSDSDDWPSSDQDEVVHSLSKDVKEHFGMLVFAKFAGHPPHPAVIWDPRFSLPRVKKQWYRSTKKDKEYIVKWLGYDAECPMWNKVPERCVVWRWSGGFNGIKVHDGCGITSNWGNVNGGDGFLQH